MSAPVPMWNDGRNADHCGLTLRECPDLLPVWRDARPPLRVRLARWWDVIETALAIAGAIGLTALLVVGLTY